MELSTAQATSAVSNPVRSKGHLQRIVGVGFGIAVGIGATIGPSILRTPGEIAAQVRSAWLLIAIWILGGIYAFFGAVAVTELGTMLPQEGGWYVYSRAAFGEYAGFLVGCCDWTMQAAAIGYSAIAFAEFTIALRPDLAPHLTLLAVGVVVFLTALNWIGVRSSSRTQEITSLIKALALFAFVAACFVVPPGKAASPVPYVLPMLHGGLLLALVIAMQGVIATYDGWYSAIYFMEEDKDPVRNLPRSTIGGVLMCIAIFLLVNFALLRVLHMPGLAGSEVPAADAAMAIFGPHGKQIILVIAIITVLSSMNACLLCASRILFALGRERLLPPWLSAVNSGGTPSTALLMCALLSIGLVVSGTFETLIAVATFLFVTVYISGFSALFKLRAKQPAMVRPFKAWGYPWSTLFVLLASVGFLVGAVISDLKHSLFTLVLIAANYPIYHFWIKGRVSKSEAEVSVLNKAEGDS
jgi:APA family basic amino acid/polyamine antiporter